MTTERKILLGTIVTAAVLIVIAVWSWRTNGPAGVVNVVMGGWVGYLLTQVRRHKSHLKRLQDRLDVLSPYEDQLRGIGATQRPVPGPSPLVSTHNYLNNNYRGSDAQQQAPGLFAAPTLGSLAAQPDETIGRHAARILERIRQWRQIGIISEMTETQMMLVHGSYAAGLFAYPTAREELRRLLRADGSTPPLAPLRASDSLDEAMQALSGVLAPMKPEDAKPRSRERSVQL